MFINNMAMNSFIYNFFLILSNTFKCKCLLQFTVTLGSGLQTTLFSIEFNFKV